MSYDVQLGVAPNEEDVIFHQVTNIKEEDNFYCLCPSENDKKPDNNYYAYDDALMPNICQGQPTFFKNPNDAFTRVFCGMDEKQKPSSQHHLRPQP